MRVGCGNSLRAIDNFCINEVQIPMVVLMENAALKLLKHVVDIGSIHITVVASTGNNGGDALALVRHLIVLGKSVSLFVVGDANKGSEGFYINYRILKNMGVTINLINGEEGLHSLKTEILRSSVVVDGIFGTGLSREIKGIYAEVIEIINKFSAFTLCIDIPSGMHCDNGEILGSCVKGNKTVTFEVFKRGFLKYGAQEYTGEIIVEPIGIPDSVLTRFSDNLFITDKKILEENIKKRDLCSHKGDFGRTAIVGGSIGMYGALLLAAEAAVRCGSGLVTAVCTSEVEETIRNRVTEVMTLNLNSSGFGKLLFSADCIAVGVGFGNNSDSVQAMSKIINEAHCPLVIDADGLNILSSQPKLLDEVKERAVNGRTTILTPHPGEMSRLTGKSAEFINENRIEITEAFSRDIGAIVLLKGYNTVITDGTIAYINPTGSSTMASGGMGDCLTGIIASLLGQGVSGFISAVCGAYLHGYCGDVLSKKMHSVTASDVIEYLPFALKEILYE